MKIVYLFSRTSRRSLCNKTQTIKCCPINSMFTKQSCLLSHKDSNLVKQNQNLLCYHYTMRQNVKNHLLSRANGLSLVLIFSYYLSYRTPLCPQCLKQDSNLHDLQNKGFFSLYPIQRTNPPISPISLIRSWSVVSTCFTTETKLKTPSTFTGKW